MCHLTVRLPVVADSSGRPPKTRDASVTHPDRIGTYGTSKHEVIQVKRVYVAAPFRRLAEEVKGREYGRIRDHASITLLEAIADGLVKAGYLACLPHRDRGEWGALDIPVEEVAEMCFAEMASSDIVVAMPQLSRGVHVELGYAAANAKRLVILTGEDEKPSQFTHGFHLSTPTVWLHYAPGDDIPALVLEGVAQVQRLPQIESASRPSPKAYGAIRVALVDLGSSTIKATVAEVSNAGVKYVWKASTSEVCLADDVRLSGSICEATLGHLQQVLHGWKDLFGEYGVESVSVVGGGALRKASNSPHVISEISAHTGWTPSPLTPERETAAVFTAAASDFGASFSRPIAVLNVGGSTVHIAIGTPSCVEPRLWMYEDIGVNMLNAGLCDQGYPPSEGRHEEMRGMLLAHMSELPTEASLQPLLVHTGGELDYMRSAQCPLVWRRHSRAHPEAALVGDFRRFCARIRALDRDALYALAPDPTNPRWMDGAISSNLIADVVAELLGVDEIVPSNLNVTDGLALQGALAHSAELKGGSCERC